VRPRVYNSVKPCEAHEGGTQGIKAAQVCHLRKRLRASVPFGQSQGNTLTASRSTVVSHLDFTFFVFERIFERSVIISDHFLNSSF